MTDSYQVGFESQTHEQQDTQLKIEGSLPGWLTGTLIRNCPSKFDFEKGPSVNHWFDGLSMLHSFNFQNGAVKYSCKFLQTDAYTESRMKERLCSREFGSDPNMNVIDRALGVFSPHFTDNSNVNVARYGDSYVALTETLAVWGFDLESLSTLKQFRFEDGLSGHVTTAHPHFDFTNNCSFNLFTKIGPTSTYQIYRLPHGSNQRSLVTTLRTNNPAYIHSFAITENYIVLVEFPLLLNPLSLLFSGKPYIENYAWHPNKGTRFHVLEKSSGRAVATADCEPCFSFHHVNAFERGREIAIDLLAYPDASIVDALRLENLRAAKTSLPEANLHRFIINLDSKQITTEKLCSISMELPRINYSSCNAQDYRFLYSAGTLSPDNFLERIIKFDVNTGNTTMWEEPGCYPGEPVFVKTPQSSTEDNGVILSLVLNSKTKQSFLLVLDAVTMTEQARITLPRVIAFGFHGQFFQQRQ